MVFHRLVIVAAGVIFLGASCSGNNTTNPPEKLSGITIVDNKELYFFDTMRRAVHNAPFGIKGGYASRDVYGTLIEATIERVFYDRAPPYTPCYHILIEESPPNHPVTYYTYYTGCVTTDGEMAVAGGELWFDDIEAILSGEISLFIFQMPRNHGAV